MIWDMTLDTLFWLSTSACSIIHLEMWVVEKKKITEKEMDGYTVNCVIAKA